MTSLTARYLKLPILISWFLLCVCSGSGQSITNYSLTSTVSTYTNFNDGATHTGEGSSDDGSYDKIPIGFDFWYMGAKHNYISACTNGWVFLGENITTYSLANDLVSGGTRPLLAPLWDDLAAPTPNDLTFKTVGSAGSRVFNLQFNAYQWDKSAGGDVISFQVLLHEGTGVIDYIYDQGATAINSGSASIGITTSGTGSGSYLSLDDENSPTIQPSSTTETNNLGSGGTKPDAGRKFSFTPPVPTAPTSLTYPAESAFSIDLSWTDSPDEVRYLIYISEDNVDFIFVEDVAAGTTTYTASGLAPSTTYYFEIYSLSEGALSSTPLTDAGGHATTACGGAAATSWDNGGDGTSWTDPLNWTDDVVPSCNSDVTITFTADKTIDLLASTTINSLTLVNGSVNVDAQVDLGVFRLTILGNLSSSITGGNPSTNTYIDVGNSPSQLDVQGNATFSGSTGTVYAIKGDGNTTGRIIFRGDVTLSDANVDVDVANVPEEVIMGKNGTQTITCNSTNTIELGRNFQVGLYGSSNTVIAGGNSTLKSKQNLTVKSGSTLDLGTLTINNGGSEKIETITLEGTAKLILGAGSGGQTGSNFPSGNNNYVISPTSTIEYDANGGTNQTIFTTPTYGNLTCSSGNAVATTKTAGAALNIDGNLQINANATFDASTFAHTIAGNFDNDGTFTDGTSTFTFDGGNAQSISGTSATTFNNVTINKSSNDLTLSRAVTVDGVITLTLGDIISASATKLTVAATGSFAGAAPHGSATSMIAGEMDMIYGSTTLGVVPIGDGTRFKPIGITPDAATSQTWILEFVNSSPPNETVCSDQPLLNHVSSAYFWEISRSGTVDAQLRFYWDGTSGVDEANLGDLEVVHFSSTCANQPAWDLSDAVNYTTDGTNDFIEMVQVQTTFSKFTLGSTTTNHTLGSLVLFWISDAGSWTDGSQWSTSSGGGPCTCVPTINDHVKFDSNSFSDLLEATRTVTIPVGTHQMKSMKFLDNSKTPFIKGSGSLVVGQ